MYKMDTIKENGVMEYWSNGINALCLLKISTALQYSITPTLQKTASTASR
jgi:hypothetical protein